MQWQYQILPSWTNHGWYHSPYNVSHLKFTRTVSGTKQSQAIEYWVLVPVGCPRGYLVEYRDWRDPHDIWILGGPDNTCYESDLKLQDLPVSCWHNDADQARHWVNSHAQIQVPSLWKTPLELGPTTSEPIRAPNGMADQQ